MNRNTKNLLFILLFTYTLLVRYPSANYPAGVDSFYNLIQGNLLLDRGQIPWFVSLFSAFGFYPLSQEIAIPISLATVSLFTGFSMEITALLISIFFGTLGTFSMFLLTKEVTNKFSASFFSSLIYSSSSAFLGFTSWNLSSRGPFVAVLPLLLYVIINNERNFKMFTLFIGMFISLLMMHNLSFIMIYMVSISIVYYTILNYPKLRYFLSHGSSYISLIFLFLLMAYFGLIRNPGIESLSEDIFNIDNHFLRVFFNLAFEYIKDVGLLSPFILFGLKPFFKGRTTFGSRNALPVIFLFMVPFMLDITYVSIVVNIFICLIVAIGINEFYRFFIVNKNFKPSSCFSVFLSFTIIMCSIPNYVVFVDNSDDYHDLDGIYFSSINVGIYTKIELEDEVLYSVGSAKRIGAYNGGNTLHDFGTDLLTHKALTPEQVITRSEFISPLAVIKGEISPTSFFTLDDWTGQKGGYYVSKRGPYVNAHEFNDEFTVKFMESYNVHYVFSIHQSESVFLDSIYNNKFKIYSDNYQGGYYVYSQ